MADAGSWDEQRAEEFAREHHAGQVDKAGRPYVEHPMRVRDRVRGPAARMAALLHDVIEDCGVTAEELLADGCPADVVRAVQALTKVKGEPLEASMRRVAADPLAVQVKRADIADNSDPARLAVLEPALAERLAEKYRRSTALLDQLAAAGGTTSGA